MLLYLFQMATSVRYWRKVAYASLLLFPCPATMVNLSLYSIKAVLLLDAEGNRVLAKYYGSDYTNLKEQKAFEKGLYDKTKRAQGTWDFCSILLSVFTLDLFIRRSGAIRQPSRVIPIQHWYIVLRGWVNRRKRADPTQYVERLLRRGIHLIKVRHEKKNIVRIR